MSNSREYFISYTKGTKRTVNSYYDRAYYEALIVSGKVRLHPCQKPVSILEEIIATHTNEGETVLDCFMGSGSTVQPAINLNRNFIGFDLDNTYFNKASNALNKDTAC
ncbi:DNA methyltransferase [Peribacillus frigoritolerans]